MLKLTVRAKMNSLFTLEAGAFTKDNTGAGAMVTAFTPRGVLGGTVAMIKGSYVCGQADGSKGEIGLFANDAAGEAFNNAPAVASGKIAIVSGMASCEVDVYADVDFAIGDKLYSDANGFLTNVESASKTVIGICTKVPTVESPTLGLDVRV